MESKDSSSAVLAPALSPTVSRWDSYTIQYNSMQFDAWINKPNYTMTGHDVHCALEGRRGLHDQAQWKQEGVNQSTLDTMQCHTVQEQVVGIWCSRDSCRNLCMCLWVAEAIGWDQLMALSCMHCSCGIVLICNSNVVIIRCWMVLSAPTPQDGSLARACTWAG